MMTLTKAQFGFTLSCNCGCGQSLLVQSSDDYPSLAEAFGWSPVTGSPPEYLRRALPGDAVNSAFDHLCGAACFPDTNTADDPGYFDHGA